MGPWVKMISPPIKESLKTPEQIAKEIYEVRDMLNKLLQEAVNDPRILVFDYAGGCMITPKPDDYKFVRFVVSKEL